MDLMDIAMELMGNTEAYINTDVAAGLADNYTIAINDVEIPMKGSLLTVYTKVTEALDYGVCVDKVNNIEVKIANPVAGGNQVTDAELVGEDKDKVEIVKDATKASVVWLDNATTKEMAKGAKYVAGKSYTACVLVKLKEYSVFTDNFIATVNDTTADVIKVDDNTCLIKYTCVVEANEVVKDAKRNTTSFSDKTFNYVITKEAAGKKAGEVAIAGLVKKNIKKANIKATVKYNKAKYKVTAINKNAFKGAKKLKTVTIGKNVKTIGAKAFYNLKKLSKVTINSKKVKKIGKKAFFKKGKKLTIKVNKKAKKNIKKLLKKAKCKGVKVK